MTAIVIIESSGAIRINRGGVVNTYANTTYLAEALVGQMEATDSMQSYADKIRKAAHEPPGELTASQYQNRVLKAVNEEIPF
jgi:hypothetical protein